MRNPRSSFAIGLALSAALSASAVGAPTPADDALRSTSKAVLWSGAVTASAEPSAEVAECAETPCDRFDLTVRLPNGVWKEKAGGVQVAIRWSGSPGDNLRLYVYRSGEPVARSDGIFASAQSLLIPQAENGTYSVYVAFDPESASSVIAYDGRAEVEYAAKRRPLRPLLPDLAVRPHRHVTFETPPPIFFEPAPEPGRSCFATEEADEGARTCLRFDQIIANDGEGALELRFALPHDPAARDRLVHQRLYWSDDPARFDERPAGEWEFHPAHDHYHFTGLALSRLWAATETGQRLGSEPIRTSRKVGICLLDSELQGWDRKGDGPRTYNAPNCFFPVDADGEAAYLVQGVTNGWADVYEWYVPDQYIEVSGLSDGTYVLETIADPDGGILEADESNNCASVVVRIRGVDAGAPSAELVGPGPAC